MLAKDIQNTLNTEIQMCRRMRMHTQILLLSSWVDVMTRLSQRTHTHTGVAAKFVGGCHDSPLAASSTYRCPCQVCVCLCLRAFVCVRETERKRKRERECVCVRVHVFVRLCVHVCVCVCVYVWV